MAKYSEIEKIAIVISSLKNREKETILGQMNPELVKRILNLVPSLGSVSNEDRESIMKSFMDQVKSTETPTENRRQVEDLFRKHFSESGDVSFNENLSHNLFVETANNAPLEALESFVRDQEPLVVSTLLGILNVENRAGLFKVIEVERQAEVARYLAEAKMVQKDAMEELEEALMEHLKAYNQESRSQLKVGGIDIAADLLASLPGEDVDKILSKISDENDQIAEQIKDKLFQFEDLIRVSEKSLPKLMGSIDKDDLAQSLKLCSSALKEHVFKGVSNRVKEDLTERMNIMPPKRKSDIEDIQRKIVQIALELSGRGEIQIIDKNEDYV